MEEQKDEKFTPEDAQTPEHIDPVEEVLGTEEESLDFKSRLDLGELSQNVQKIRSEVGYD